MTLLRKLYRLAFPTGRPLRWLLPSLILLALVLLAWRAPQWASRIEAWTIDERFRLRGVHQPRSPIVIVALDETSAQMMGDLRGENIRTWPRARWAELVTKIAAGSPRVIALDVVFDTPGWDAGGDDALTGALAQAGNVVLASHLEQSGGETYENVTLSPPIAALAEAAAGVGVANFAPDADGAIRREQLLWTWGGKIYPSLPTVVATLFAGQPLDVDRADLGADLTLPIHFRGPEGTFRTLSMYSVWAGEAAPDVFRDAIVLVGYTTQLEQDRHPAPFAETQKLPGVEIQANAVDTLLAGDWLHRLPAWSPPLLVAASGLLALVLLNLGRPSLGVLALAGAAAAYIALTAALFIWADFTLPVFEPINTAVLVGGAALAERMVFAEQDKRRMRQRFAGVMSPERLQAVLDNWEALLETERPKKLAAIIFADVRGFTNATETLMRQDRSSEMVRFLSAYLDAMAEAVYAEGGVIYDVVGDGLMILFGVPEPLPDYALHAVRAAVRMSLAARDLQAVWPLRDQRPLGMGIGVHCGPVVDAVVGRGRRINYQVIGDPVNTTARIEAHCKVAMEIPRPPGGEVPETVTILISGDVHDQVREHVLVDESVPPFAARGKAEPLRVARVLGLREPVE